MTIETDRLSLVLLTAEQLRLWAEDISALEEELRCRYLGEAMEGVFLEIVNGQIPKAEKDRAHTPYHSFWFLVRRSDRAVLGSACFKNVPGKTREVEIGYGLGPAFTGRGYMTEAIRAMCGWAFQQAEISYVIAETNADNLPSQNVLRRCGFTVCRQGEALWWRHAANQPPAGDSCVVHPQ